MQDTKILYITSEITPFVETSSISPLVRSLAESCTKKKMTIRIFLPRFGVINQLKNHVHSIFRLSGINIPVGKEHISLVVKVASIKEIKTQVYFADNEDLFQRKGIFQDQNGNWYEDNDIRSIFFCKSVLTAVKEVGWSPDIIHCHGWFSSFIPMYLKTTYKNSPIFKNTKSIYTFYPDQMNYTFKDDIFKKAKLREVKEEHLAPIGKGDFQGLANLAASYSDVCTRSFEKDDNYSIAWLEKFNVSYIPDNEHLADKYFQKYQELLEKT